MRMSRTVLGGALGETPEVYSLFQGCDPPQGFSGSFGLRPSRPSDRLSFGVRYFGNA